MRNAWEMFVRIEPHRRFGHGSPRTLSMQSNIHWTQIETEHLLISSHHWIIIPKLLICDFRRDTKQLRMAIAFSYLWKIPQTKSSIRLATPYRNVVFVIHLKWDWLRAELECYEYYAERVQYAHESNELQSRALSFSHAPPHHMLLTLFLACHHRHNTYFDIWCAYWLRNPIIT